MSVICYPDAVRISIDLSPEAYHLAKAVANERNVSLGKVVSELILKPTPSPSGSGNPAYSTAGFPIFSSGKRVTSEDVAAFLDED